MTKKMTELHWEILLEMAMTVKTIACLMDESFILTARSFYTHIQSFSELN